MSVPRNSELIPIWHFRWAERGTVERWNAGGSATMTPDKLAELVREAQRIGYEQGEAQGRANLRMDIEAGEIEPIKPPADEWAARRSPNDPIGRAEA